MPTYYKRISVFNRQEFFTSTCSLRESADGIVELRKKYKTHCVEHASSKWQMLFYRRLIGYDQGCAVATNPESVGTISVLPFYNAQNPSPSRMSAMIYIVSKSDEYIALKKICVRKRCSETKITRTGIHPIPSGGASLQVSITIRLPT